MFNIHDLTPKDQAVGQKRPRQYKPRRRTQHAFPSVVKFDTRPGAPTLQQAQDIASGSLARLIVAYFREHSQGFPQPPAMEGGEQ